MEYNTAGTSISFILVSFRHFTNKIKLQKCLQKVYILIVKHKYLRIGLTYLNFLVFISFSVYFLYNQIVNINSYVLKRRIRSSIT